MKHKFYHFCIALVILFFCGCAEVTNNDQLINVSGLGWSEAAKGFLVQGANVNARNEDGITPLMSAAWNGDLSTVQLLLDHGAAVNMQDNTGQTALYNAATYQGNSRVVEALLAAGADVNINNMDGYSPLLTALIEGHTYVAHVLLHAGADVNARTKYGYTPLFRAARGGYTDIAQELIDRGAEIDAREAFAEATPLMYAIDKDRADIVRILIAAGADVNARDCNGNTPLMAAQNKTAIKNLLLKAGAIQPEKSGQYDDSIYDFVNRMYGKDGVLDEQDKTVAHFERGIKAYAIEQGKDLSESEMEYYRAMYHVARQEYDMALPFMNGFLEKNSDNAKAYYDRAWIYGSLGNVEKAIQDYSRAIELNTSFILAYYNRGRGYAFLKKYGEAFVDFNKAIELDPGLADAYRSKAWLLATCPNVKWRDGKHAVITAKKAVEIFDDWRSQSTLAAAYAESGDFDRAVKVQRKVISLLESQQASYLIFYLSYQRLETYKTHIPWRTK